MVNGCNRDGHSDLRVKSSPSAGKSQKGSTETGECQGKKTSSPLSSRSRNWISSKDSPGALERAVVAKSRSDCCGINRIANPETCFQGKIGSSSSSSVLIRNRNYNTVATLETEHPSSPNPYIDVPSAPSIKSKSPVKHSSPQSSARAISPQRCKTDGSERKVGMMPPHLAPYYKNASLRKLKHPLEENIFTSLLITLVAIGVAIVVGIPVLICSGALLVAVLLLRYLAVVVTGLTAYVSYMCSNRNIPPRPLPHIFPRDRLAFANDVRWLGRKSRKRCQSILHTILVFEGTVDLSSLQQLVQSRVLGAETPEGELAYPRLLQRLEPLVSGYRWIFDISFDIQNHIYLGPSTFKNELEVQEYVGILLTQNLNQGKPLWEIVVLPNYGAQKDTLAVLRVHQCLADGMTLVRILSHNLADHTQMHIPQRPHFAGLSFGFNVLRSFIVGPLTLFLWLFLTFRDKNVFSRPLSANKNKRNKIKTLRKRRNKKTNRNSDFSPICSSSSPTHLERSSSGPSAMPTNISPSSSSAKDNKSRRQSKKYKAPTCASSPFPGDKKTKAHHSHGSPNEPVTTSKIRNKSSKSVSKCMWKVVWSAPMTVPKVARVKQIMRSSFNDVLLSAAAGSVRSYMQEVGVPCPDDCKVLIPVDLRNDIASPKSSTKLGCKVASVLATVPSGMEAAIPRLWATRHRLDELKASADPVVAYGATTLLMNALPQKLAISVLDSITNKASFQFSNLPGPGSTLVIGGFPLKGIYPIYPPSGKIRVAISVFTYADQVHLTVVGHRSYRNAGPKLLTGITRQGAVSFREFIRLMYFIQAGIIQAFHVEQLSRQLSQRRVPGESRRSTRNQPPPEMMKPPTRQIHIQLQVVQEELQQLSHQLDSQDELNTIVIGPQGRTLALVGSMGQIASSSSPEMALGDFVSSTTLGYDSPGGLSASNAFCQGGQMELRTRLRSLKNEFNELIGELRRRSSIVEGVTISFEDEEMEGEFRKPRKRALSVVSTTRRNSVFSSRSLNTPESSQIYSSEEDLSSNSPPPEIRMYNPSVDMRHSNSPIRTTAV